MKWFIKLTGFLCWILLWPILLEGVELDFYFEGDALYWKATEYNLSYVFMNQHSNPESYFSSPIATDSTLLNPNFKRDWGYRFGAGYHLPHDCWDLYFSWTHIRNKASNRAHVTDPTEDLYPIWSNPLVTYARDATDAAAHWRVDLNLLDLTLQREFLPTNKISLTSFISIRSAWINQKYHLSYANVTSIDATLPTPIPLLSTKMKNDYCGTGLRVGFDSLWGLGYGFKIFGDAAVSLLFGRFDIHQHEVIKPIQLIALNVREKRLASKPILDLAAGFRWEYCNNTGYFSLLILQVGWEHHMFFEQNQFLKFSDDSTQGSFFNHQGNLAFEGWTFTVRGDF